jgi:adenine-specific DNA-methyltransferase
MMEKLTVQQGQSQDIVADNIARLKQLFPEVLTETKIDFAVLKQLLGDEVEEDEERYSFTWNGKARARRLAQTPSTGTLRPCKEESKDWDTTQNLFIEGDNLEVLKLLQKCYHQKVKMIYIDPPYNTGKDFIYPDDFRDNIKNYLELTGQTDEAGKKLSANAETSGRYHTNWLNMMYPRLKLARNLLQDDGVIFLSIDDNEVSNLRAICDEIFGEDNFHGCISRVTGTPTGGGNKAIVNAIDYILVYSKTADSLIEGLAMTEGDARIYDQEDVLGKYLIRSLRRTGGEDRREDRPSMFYPMQAPSGENIYPYGPTGYESRWICGAEKYKELLRNNLIEWRKVKKDGSDIWQVYQKFYLEGRQKQPSNLWDQIEGNKKATRDLKKLFDENKVFDFPKPVELIRRIIQLSARDADAIVLDFFAGSGTTAQAVMEENIFDTGKRRYVLVQLPEPLDPENKDQNSASDFCDKLKKPQTIAELTKERLRRVAKKIKEESPNYQGDLGFKAFKLDSSNIKPWDADFDTLSDDLLTADDVIKPERSADDVLFEILLKYGLDLTLPITTHMLAGKSVFEVGAGALLVCLEEGITEAVAEAIGQLKTTLAPAVCRVVFKDAGFADDAAKVNAVQVLKQFGIDDVKSL